MSWYRGEGSVVKGNISIGDDSSVWYNAVLRADFNSIVIGRNVNVQDNATLHAGKESGIVIDDNVTIGHNAIIHGCTLHRNVLVGMGAILMNHAEIGENSIVGAGALITEGKKFPPDSLIIGFPAKAVRKLTSEEIQKNQRTSEEYVSAAEKELTRQ